MPNWCFNYVIFNGDKENLDKLTTALDKAKKDENEQRQAQKIHSLDEVKDGYFFDIYFERREDCTVLQYESRWSPNIDDVAELCKEYKVSAMHDYSEPGCQIYGTVAYEKSGEYTEEQIHQEFLDLIEYDNEIDKYLYKGEYWECESDLIETEYPIWKENNF